MSKRGMLIVLSGPSGVGKGTVRKALFSQPGNDFQYSVSMTTRQPRPGEVNGKDYFFVSKEEFELRQRLIHRGTDSMEVINKRIHKAFGEIQMMQNYDYAVVNDQVDNAVTKIKDIIRSERLRVPRVMPDYLEMLGDSEK